MLTADNIQIETTKTSDIGLRKSIFTKKQLEEFVTLQDIKVQGWHIRQKQWNLHLVAGRRKVNGGWPWEVNPATMIDLIDMSFIPLCKVVGPFLFFASLLLMV
jgi:hypothetical protein